MENDTRTIGVLGTGTMGAGIAQVAAQAGFRVIACDNSVAALEKAQLYVKDGLDRFVDKDVLSEDAAESARASIHWTINPDDLAGAEAVIEAVIERVEPKKEALGVLDEVLPSGSLILTNTSSISITDLASATRRPDKVCGTHFFTPPPLREAVEVPRGLLTSDETVERVKDLVTAFGKQPVVVKDVPGFVANRFLMPMLIEASRLLEEGVAGKEEIDLLVRKGIGFPIGPFELGDLIGLDVALDIISYMHQELNDPYYAPPHLLETMVRAGKLGRKTGEGFYEYS